MCAAINDSLSTKIKHFPENLTEEECQITNSLYNRITRLVNNAFNKPTTDKEKSSLCLASLQFRKIEEIRGLAIQLAQSICNEETRNTILRNLQEVD